MKLAVLVLLVTLSVGCTRRSTLAGGGAVTLGGVVMLGMAGSMDAGCAADDPFCGVFVEGPTRIMQAGVTGMGVVALLGGLALLAAGASMTGEERPTSAQRAPEPSTAPADQPTRSMEPAATW